MTHNFNFWMIPSLKRSNQAPRERLLHHCPPWYSQSSKDKATSVPIYIRMDRIHGIYVPVSTGWPLLKRIEFQFVYKIAWLWKYCWLKELDRKGEINWLCPFVLLEWTNLWKTGSKWRLSLPGLTTVALGVEGFAKLLFKVLTSFRKWTVVIVTWIVELFNATKLYL